MRILKQIIEKKIELYNELILNRQYLRGIWQFYCCYNIALVILNLDESKEIKKRNKLWKRWLLMQYVFDEKKFKKIKFFMREDMEIIVNALKLIIKEQEKTPYDFGNIYKEWAVGILSYEMPE